MGKASNQFEINSEYYIDSTNHLSVQEVSRLRFQINKPSEFHFENDNSIWLKIDLKIKEFHEEQFVLGFTQPFIDSIVVYNVSSIDTTILASADIINTYRSGFYKTLANPTVNFNIKKIGVNQIFICLRNKIGVIKVKILVTDTETALNEIVTYERLISIFFGCLCSIFILSIIFFLISRTTMYLFYSLYIGFICTFLESTLGNLNIFFPNIHELLKGQNSDAIYGFLAVIFNLLFLEKLFAIQISNFHFQIFKRSIILISISFLIYDLATKALNTSLLVPLLMIILQICILFFAIHQKNNLYKLYLIGLFPLAIICIIRVLALLNLIVQPYGIGGLVLPAVSFELLILMVLQSKVFFDEIKQKNALEARIVLNQIETQESERQKIAADLHDDLGSTLAVLKDKISYSDLETKGLINKAISDLRSISHNLMPPNFEIFGFIPSLEKYIETLNQLGLKITLIVFGNKITLHADTELNIYRILTEILHNIRKHSQSKEATIQLIYHDTFLYVSVENNDKTENNLEKNVGIGEKSISSRLEYLHARVLEEGKTQNGYSYIFEVPYEKNPNS